VTDVTIAHLSDPHYGAVADLPQLEELETFVPGLKPDAVVISGDLTQRARHGEFQAARAFTRRMEAAAPTVVIPGNHDVQWWRSPFGLAGSRVKYRKYRQYFGEVLVPTLRIPGAVIAGILTSYGVSLRSMTWNLNDLAVKGHLPASEVERVRSVFARAPEGSARIAVVHHNVLRGEISGRMGLARWRTAQRRLLELGADVVLCGHDHQESAGQIADRLPVSTTGTHTLRTRGSRPTVFNLVRISSAWVQIEHYRWSGGEGGFRRSDTVAFARLATPAVPLPHGLVADA